MLPAYRGRGLGRAALVAALARLRAAGIPRIGLEVETDNTPAFRLYEQTGFVTTTTYGYYAIPLDPA